MTIKQMIHELIVFVESDKFLLKRTKNGPKDLMLQADEDGVLRFYVTVFPVKAVSLFIINICFSVLIWTYIPCALSPGAITNCLILLSITVIGYVWIQMISIIVAAYKRKLLVEADNDRIRFFSYWPLFIGNPSTVSFMWKDIRAVERKLDDESTRACKLVIYHVVGEDVLEWSFKYNVMSISLEKFADFIDARRSEKLLIEALPLNDIKELNFSHELVVFMQGDRILLMRDAKRVERLKLPGGKVEAGEGPKQTALRELFEELGVQLDEQALKPLCQFSFNWEGLGYHHVIYLVDTLVEGMFNKEPEECSELVWVNKYKLPDEMLPPIREALQRAFL